MSPNDGEGAKLQPRILQVRYMPKSVASIFMGMVGVGGWLEDLEGSAYFMPGIQRGRGGAF